MRNILFFSLIIPLFIPLRIYVHVLPVFSDKLQQYSAEEAEKTARYISQSLISQRDGHLEIEQSFYDSIDEVVDRFDLEKVKVFSESGLILFSTDKNDIGKVNSNSYFYERVAKGETIAKLVENKSKSLEGRIMTRDVAEVYVPLMDSGRFIGAFELYYDLTARKRELDMLFWKEAAITVVTSLVLIGVICVLLVKTSNAMHIQEVAEGRLRRANELLEARVAERTEALELTQDVSINCLATLAEYYDQQTGMHLYRIKAYTRMIADGLSRESAYSPYLSGRRYADDISRASVLHDIGKIAVSQKLLMKPGKLTPAEFEEVKKHTLVAGSILTRGNRKFVERFGSDSYLALAADIASSHHERWDGSGYPAGLAGEDIPLSARIVALADVYDALRSERPYKAPWSHEKAVELIVSEGGRHFDPEIVGVFMLYEQRFRMVSQGEDVPKGGAAGPLDA